MKGIFLFLFLINIAYAGFQTVQIGHIDKHYEGELSKEQVLIILKDIENLFESQLGFNVFDYSQNGKVIDIIYLAPSRKKKKLLANIKKSESLKNKIDNLQLSISVTQLSIEASRKELNIKYEVLNKAIQQLNASVSNIQETINEVSRREYEEIQKKIAHETRRIEKNQVFLKKEKKKFSTKLRALKQKIRKFNLLVVNYNRVQRDIEKLSKTIVEIKGVTKGSTKTTYTSYIEDGQKNVKKSTHTSMEKIEIYSFDNLQQLKVVLAHELGHLVGVGHIDVVAALMNPHVQEKQLDELSFTYDDIEAFYEAFE